MECPPTDEEALKRICELVKEDKIDEAIDYCRWAIRWCGRGLHGVDWDLYFLKHNLGVSKEYFLSKWCKQFMPKPTPQPQKPTKPEKPKERPVEILDDYVEWYIVTEDIKLRDMTIEPNNEPVRIPKNAKMTVYAKLKQSIDESEVVARVSFDGQPTGIAKSYYGSTHEYIEVPLSVAEYNHSVTFEVQKIDTQREEGGWIGWYPIKEGKHSIRLDIYSKPSGGYPYGTGTPYQASIYTKHIGSTSPILVDINGEVKRFVPASPLRKAPYKGYVIIIKKLSGNRYKVLVPAVSREGGVLKYQVMHLVDNSKGLTDEEIERGGEYLEYGSYRAELKTIKLNGGSTWGYEFEITVPEDAIDPMVVIPGVGFFVYKKIYEEIHGEAPNPRIVDAYMEYDGNKLYAGNTVEIREGTEMKAVVTVKNEGADGRVFVWVYDYDTHKIVKSKEVFMKAGEQKTYELTFVPELGDHRYSIMVGLELGTYTDFAGG